MRILSEPVAAKDCEVRITAADGYGKAQVTFKLYHADEELVKTVMESTVSSGETDTAIWMKAGR